MSQLFFKPEQSNNLDINTATAATVSVSASNDFYKANAASNAQVFLIPNPSTVKGKVFTFEKVDTTLNVVTLNDGSNVTTLNTNGEAVQIVSDGASYQIFNRRIPSGWAGGLTLVPASAAFGTIFGSTSIYKREGDSIRFRGYFQSGTAAAGLASFALPAGVTIASSKVFGIGETQAGSFYAPPAAANAVFDNATAKAFGIVTCNAASLGIVCLSIAGQSLIIAPAQGNQVVANSDAVLFDFTVPVSGWNS